MPQCHCTTDYVSSSAAPRLTITFVLSRIKRHSPSSAPLVSLFQPGGRRLTRQPRGREENVALKHASPPLLAAPGTKICSWGLTTTYLSRTRVQRLVTNERSIRTSSQQANARPSAQHVMQRGSPITGPCGSASSQPILPLIKPKLGPGAVRCTVRLIWSIEAKRSWTGGISVDINPPRYYDSHYNYGSASLESSRQERRMRESGKSQIDELNSRHQHCPGRVHDNVGEEEACPRLEGAKT